MPFCSICGQFSIQLDSRNHCQPCSDAYFSKEIKEKDINGAKIKIEKNLRYKMLNYINDVELKTIVIGANIPNAQGTQRQHINNQNFIEPTYRKSTIALVLSVLGFILFFIPGFGIFSLGFELIALSLAITSRRTEPTNQYRKIAIIVFMIYILLIIIGIIYLIMNPEIVYDMMAELEAQGLL